MLVGAILLTVVGLAARAADIPPPRTVSIVNPSARATLSGTFNVQVRVFDPAGLTGVVVELSTNGGSTYTHTLTKSTTYTFSTANTAIFEKPIPGLSGAYTLVARSTTTGNVRTTSTPMTVTVVAAKTGDGKLVRRDNSSQLCSDCHALATHSSETTTGNHGTWSTNCRDCHTPHQTTNAFLIPNQITPPGSAQPKNVYYSKPTGVAQNDGATDKANASFVNPDLTGPCQVCHTLTSRYTSGALGSTSHKGNCIECHKHVDGFKGSLANCTGCHGDVNRTGANAHPDADTAVAAAPPRDTNGDLVATDPQVGTHLKHVNNLTSTLREKPLLCADCHNGALHSQPVVQFGALARTAWTGEPAINPQYDNTTTPASPKCSNTYCHGAFKDGNFTTATWNVPSGGSLPCNSCHALPPANTAHQPTVEFPDPTRCGDCHLGFTISTVSKPVHINGVVNLSNCSQCHGDQNRTVYAGTETEAYVKGAPPLDVAQTSTGPKIGSHIPHVNQDPLVAKGSAVSRWCDNCHPASTPTDPGHQTDNNTLPIFGNLANAAAATPTYGYVDPAAARVPANMTCSMVYCHGQFPYGRKELNAPLYWGQGSAAGACGTCHLAVSSAPALSHPQNTNCGLCHPSYTANTVAAATHVDGLPTMVAGRTGCVGCHGDPTAVLAVTGGTSDTNWKAAPPYGTRNETTVATRAVGAHTAHVNANRLRNNALACTECHPDRSSDTGATHATGAVENAWGALAAFGTTATKTTWNGTTLTCNNYCHGKTLAGATKANPSWVGGVAEAPCNGCHASTFATPGAAGNLIYHPTYATCADCHGAGYTSSSVASGAKATHLDTLKNLPSRTGACNKCHGWTDVGSSGGFVAAAGGAAANAIAAPGTPGTASTYAVGAHTAHVNQATTPMSPPFACSECHGAAEATASDHANGNGAPLSTDWGTIAKATGMVPSYTAGSCTNTYCHSKYTAAATPGWNTAGKLGCTSCHASSFATPSASNNYHPANASCGSCHGSGYTSTTIDATAKATHIADMAPTLPSRTGSCNKCHGWTDIGSPGGFVAAAGGSAANAISAPGTAASTSTYAVGAHTAHVNQANSPMSSPFACSECHGAAETSAADHANGNGTPLSTDWGTIAKATGMTPSYTAGSCTSTYCHSKYTTSPTPSWNTAAKLGCTSCHPNSFASPAAANNYHPQNAACTQCHGAGYTDANTVAASVKATHVDMIVTFSPARSGGCNKCHGFADGYVVNSNAGGTTDPNAISMPGTVAMATSTDPGQGIAGAHEAHVNQAGNGTTTFQYMAPIHCTECHGNDKTSAADHANGSAAPDMITASTIADAVGMTNPQYVNTSGACTNTYCHTKFAVTPYVAANLPAPTWQTAGKLWCDACHGDPPAFNSNGVTAHPQGNNSCSTCHPGYGDKGADSRPRLVSLSSHVNGIVTGASGCTSCHGGTNAGNPTGNAAPPLGAANPGPAQETLTTEPAVGAHQKHLSGGTIRLAMQCSDCHPSYSDLAHSSPPYGYNFSWSILSTNNSTLTPTYNTTGTDYNCSNVYCHGAVTNTTTQPGATHPVAKWTGGAAEVSCTSCHGSPPPLLTTPYHPANGACSDCHGAGYTSATALAGPPATHVDRTMDLPNRTGSCNRCHGFTDVGSAGGFVAAAAGSAANAIAAPGTPATTAAAAGAHTAHVNQANSPVMPAIACGECHGAAETSAADHVNGNGLPLSTDWGSIAKGGALNKSPSYSAGSCTNTYCHNQYTAAATPSWSTAGKLGCASCHANSFPTPTLANNYHPANPTCSSCHGTGYTNATTIDATAKTTHIADTAPTLPSRTGTCNRCHGSLDGYVVNTNAGGTADSMRVIGAPGTPARATGTDPGQGVVGAHQAHVNQAGDGTTTFQYMKPIACTECHGAAKSSGSDHADGSAQPDMISASLISDAAGMTNPQYVNSGGTAGTCTNTYCHTKYAVTPYAAANLPAPTWQSTGGKLWCNACHDDPPAFEVTNPTTPHSTNPNCGGCHAGYAAKGADSRPRAVNLSSHLNGLIEKTDAAGNADCSACHGALVTAMSSGNASGYHHLMQNSAVTNLASGNKYPNVGGDATSPNRRCLLCHADHDLFSNAVNPNTAYNGRARNLRTDIAVTALSGSTGAGYTNTDYDGTLTNGGICVSCHTNVQTKSYTQRDGSGTTMAIPKAGYEGSVHNYYATSTFKDGSTFNANCSKCHGDRSAGAYQTTAAPRQFSLHDSPQRRMTNPINDAVVTGTANGTQGANIFVDTTKTFPTDAYNGMAITVFEGTGTARTNIIKATGYTANGTPNANTLVMAKPWGTLPINGTSSYVINDPMEERVCTQCHSGGTPGLDAFGTLATSYRSGQQMTAKSKTFDQYLKIYGVGTIALTANSATVAGASTNWITSSGTATGVSATFTHDSQTVQFSAALPADATWLGRSIKDGQAGRGTVRWYSIVGMSADKTQLIISPPYIQATVAGVTTWAVSFGDWYLQCGTDTGWYRINDVTSATAATIYPNYGGAACGAGSQYVLRSVPGHPLALTAAVHKPDETTVQGWNDPASSTRPRHVTCVDCHNTHDASVGNHTVGGGQLGNTNAGVPGVSVTYATPRTLSGTFTTNSRTISAITGGTVSSADVGKNVLGPDGLVYPIAAAPTTTSLTIGLTAGYKGTLTGARSFQIQDPATAPTYTVVPSLTTANWQYELCIKCHSAFAYGANPPQSMFFSSANLGSAATGNQTDMAKDFNPYQLAYHPIMAVGRNQPPTTANANWASSAGRKRNAPNTGLDNTFVDGWGSQSRVACTDCHESESSTDPWGPHGTANQWLLKGIDPNVTVTIASGTVVYPNVCFYPGGGSAVSSVPDTGDYKNACLNCHRADVYGLVSSGGSATGSSCNGGTTLGAGIPYANLARVNHPVDARAESNGVGKGALTRQGIYCMQCHGGDSLGAIHGTNSTSPGTNKSGGAQGSYRGKRFMNGATWSGTTRASTTVGVSCTTNKTLPVDTCGDNRDATGNMANYNYDSGAD